MAKLLFNPREYDPTHLDPETRDDLVALVDFFESKGNAAMKAEFHSYAWYNDFLVDQANRGTFARFGLPAVPGAMIDRPDARWDTARINELNEILGFYSLAHWYPWQVSVLDDGFSFVLEYRADGSRRVIAHPTPALLTAVMADGGHEALPGEDRQRA